MGSICYCNWYEIRKQPVTCDKYSQVCHSDIVPVSTFDWKRCDTCTACMCSENLWQSLSTVWVNQRWMKVKPMSCWGTKHLLLNLSSMLAYQRSFGLHLRMTKHVVSFITLWLLLFWYRASLFYRLVTEWRISAKSVDGLCLPESASSVFSKIAHPIPFHRQNRLREGL